MFRLRLLLVSIQAAAIYAVVLPRDSPSGVHLAVSPNCGALGGSPADVNAGLKPLSSYSTIVAFGDSYTDGGKQDGTTLLPPVVVPPNPKAGGRISNGRVWVEYLAEAANATLQDYAGTEALLDASQYPGVNTGTARDFMNQIQYSGFNTGRPRPDPATTLYTIFFGIGDFGLSNEFTNPDASTLAGILVYGLLELSSSPIFAKDFLVVDNYGRGVKTAAGEAYKQDVFTALNTLSTKYKINVGFVDFANIWNGVLGPNPGYEAFGYTSTGACTIDANTTVGACADPDSTFYYIPGNPSAATHSIMADYVSEVLTQC